MSMPSVKPITLPILLSLPTLLLCTTSPLTFLCMHIKMIWHESDVSDVHKWKSTKDGGIYQLNSARPHSQSTSPADWQVEHHWYIIIDQNGLFSCSNVPFLSFFVFHEKGAPNLIPLWQFWTAYVYALQWHTCCLWQWLLEDWNTDRHGQTCSEYTYSLKCTTCSNFIPVYHSLPLPPHT